MSKPLQGRVCLVAGATRGGGRGIAVALGELGATVICTGRSTRAEPRVRPEGAEAFDLRGRPETIEETAERVDAAGGRGIAHRCDHTDEGQVAALIATVQADHGRLDVLVNDVWGGDGLMDWGATPAQLNLDTARQVFERGFWTHLITARHALPLLLAGDRPLLIEITDGAGLYYRGNLTYDLVKTTNIRLAFALSEAHPELVAIAVTPGFLRSEAMLEHMGVTADTWKQGAALDPHFAFSESPAFVGRGVAALAADPEVAQWSGRATSSWELGRHYGLVDADGTRPDWGAHAAEEPFGADQAASHRRFVSRFGDYS